jgi:hypothetical protein
MVFHIFLKCEGIEHKIYDRGYYIFDKYIDNSPSKILFEECFEDNNCQTFPHKILKDRLPFALKVLINNLEKENANISLDDMQYFLEEYINFVTMIEKKEKETCTYCQVCVLKKIE